MWGSGDWEDKGRKGKLNNPKNKDLEFEIKKYTLSYTFPLYLS